MEVYHRGLPHLPVNWSKVMPTYEFSCNECGTFGSTFRSFTEDVPGSPLIDPVQLCGSSFGLKVRRHRLFESNMPVKGSVCNHKLQGRPVGVYGAMGDKPQGLDKVTGKYVYGGQVASSIDEARKAMDMDWAIWTELVEAIPPAFTQYLGEQINV